MASTLPRGLIEVAYEEAAQAYLRSLPPEHFMEATAQATQRMITVESMHLLHARRRAEVEKRRADEQQHRADEQQHRADVQQRRADEETRRAEDEKRRADELQKRLEQIEHELGRFRAAQTGRGYEPKADR